MSQRECVYTSKASQDTVVIVSLKTDTVKAKWITFSKFLHQSFLLRDIIRAYQITNSNVTPYCN